jgi:protein-S-isoprenylcysteine O-methyltransferase Ste14
MNPLLFHISFVVVFLGFAAIRVYYHRLAQQAQGRADFKEGRLHVALRLVFGLPFIAAVFGYMLWPALLGFAQFSLPAWAQWLGVGLGAASLPLIAWVQWALGANFATVLHVRDEHTLVTHGPYRWVRHPMYTVLYMHGLAALLLTANWLIGGVYLAALTLIVGTRVRREEAAMAEKFGPAYREYMGRTGRFLPRYSAG